LKPIKLIPVLLLSTIGIYLAFRHVDEPYQNAWVRSRDAFGSKRDLRSGAHRLGDSNTACQLLVGGIVSSRSEPISNATLYVRVGGESQFFGHTDEYGMFEGMTSHMRFRIVAEAAGFQQSSTSTITVSSCSPAQRIDVAIELTAAPQQQPSLAARNLDEWLIDVQRTETATIVVKSLAGAKRVRVAGGNFRMPSGSEPPHELYAESADWVTPRLRFKNAPRALAITKELQLPRVRTDPLGTVWRFSSAAGVFFMEKEATIPEFDACVAAGQCEQRNMKLSFNQGCSISGVGPAGCITYVNAQNFCKFMNGRLPTREEWTAEYTNGATRQHPWGNDAPSCEYANILTPIERRDRTVVVEFCAGKPNRSGCEYPAGRSASNLCDMSGNLSEWITLPPSLPFCALGMPYIDRDDLIPRCHVEGELMGVRCVSDLEAIELD
jgi:formylglycine-generating enzyme required for sulfatase activity